ncbi:MAG: D-alanyl-D-alanine carboxypeptidase [Solirubrobacterales bacterium]|nr:D-alanyl-D-alanine carboxypeptidase [Solirubrobacterales bacterium]
MTRRGVLSEGPIDRGRRQGRPGTGRPRRTRGIKLGLLGLAVVVALVVLLVLMDTKASDPARPAGLLPATPPRPVHAEHSSHPVWTLVPAAAVVRPRFKERLTSGLLFDVHSGRVLWAREPSQALAIASLTKMMTALVVAEHAPPSAQVYIRQAAIDYSGSGIGLLPLHKKVRLETLMYGLLLPSGNDAAIALAQHVAGSEDRFIAMMNRRARTMGLRCTHFTTVSGIVDRGNYSCSADLAVMAHAVLAQPRLARIVATRSIVLPFPIKGGKLYLYNNNPLLLARYPGADGVKTGYTVAAGVCLVASARRGRTRLAVVLLHSDDAPDEARQLLDAGFAKLPG